VSTALPSRRFREAQLLIVAALGLLFAMVVVEMQGMLQLARAAEDEGRRAASSAAALVGSRLSVEEGLTFAAPPREGLGVALVAGDRVVHRAGQAGPESPAWWPWASQEAWERSGRAVAGPVRLGPGQAMVAYQPLADGRVARVTVQLASARLLSRWRWLGAGLALFVAGGGGILALLLIGRVLAPYRDLLTEARRVTAGPEGKSEDRFLVDTFRNTVQRLERSETALRQRVDELAILADVLARESAAGVVITDAARAVRAANSSAGALLGEELRVGGPLPAVLTGSEGRLSLGERVVEVRRFPLLSAEGAGQGEVVFLADTTREDALERALAEREQMATIGELAAGMAHELRNALSTVKGYVRLLPVAATAERDRYLAAIDEETASLAEVLDRFLRFAQPLQLRRETVDIRALTEELAEKIRRAFPAVDLRVAGERVAVAGDRLALSVVVENLLRNAAEAAGSGGEVRARVDAGPASVRVVVEDSGAGVAEEVRARLFAPFASTKPSGGLGLALARRFARLHGGDVEYEPRTGGGARFVFRLPREAAP